MSVPGTQGAASRDAQGAASRDAQGAAVSDTQGAASRDTPGASVSDTQGAAVGGTDAHIPVMLAEMLHTLNPRDGAVYLDGTFGGGGYSRAILDQAKCHVWAMDRDETAIERGAGLAARYPGRLRLLHGRFGDMLTMLSEAGIHAVDGIVLDIGVSSFQIDDPTRGFSFRRDGPLDMRMGRHGTDTPTAATLVNTLPERDLADLLFQLGEERASRRVAHAIVAARAEAAIQTTGRLASIIRAVLPPDKSGNHPATRSFQALRLSVNDELGEIERGLAQAVRLLNPGGRIVVVSFHSLEDRIVKRFMTQVSGRAPAPSRHDPGGLTRHAPARFRLVTPKALRPDSAEVAANPRSRSARLRAIECLSESGPREGGGLEGTGLAGEGFKGGAPEGGIRDGGKTGAGQPNAGRSPAALLARIASPAEPPAAPPAGPPAGPIEREEMPA